MVSLAVDLAIACISAEVVVLLFLAFRKGAAVPARAFATLGAGFALLLALRMSIADATSLLILPVLAIAGCCHVVDLVLLFGHRAAPPIAG